MNKYQFLGQLQMSLEKKLASDEVSKVMDYYENYLNEALDYGKSEKEILDSLGDPEILASTIIDGLKEENDIEIKDSEDKTNNRSMGDLLDDLIESTSQTISGAMKVVDKTMDNVEDYINGVLNNEEFFEESEEFVKDMDVLGEVSQELTLEVQPYQEIIFELTNVPVYAKFIEAETLKVEVQRSEKDDWCLEVRHDQQCMVIKEKKAKVYRLFENNKRAVMLYLPLSYQGKLNFKCGNASLKLKGRQVKYPSPIEIHCDNGEVQIKDAILGVLSVKCANGKIDLKRVLAYKANLKCYNGLIRYHMLENDYAKNLNLKTGNGLIKINNERWSLNRVKHQIPARNQSKYELSVEAECDNGIIRLTGF